MKKKMVILAIIFLCINSIMIFGGQQDVSAKKLAQQAESLLKKKRVRSTDKKPKNPSLQKSTKKIAGKKQKKEEVLVKEDNNKEYIKKDLPSDLNDINKIIVLIYVTPPCQPGSDKEVEKVSDITITTLEIDRPTIDGRKRSLEELIVDKLLFFEAVYFYRFVLPEDAIDKYINSIKEQHHISDEKLRAMFLEAGYTYQEAREQFAMGQSIDALLNFKIRSRVAVSEKEIREYYDNNPVYEDAAYRIKKGFIPDGVLSESELAYPTVETMNNPSINWSMGYWISEDEMNEDRKEMIRLVAENECTKPEEVTGGYEVTKVLAIRPRALKTFEERYKEIMMLLQEPQYYKMLAEFKKELLSKYEIVYLK